MNIQTIDVLPIDTYAKAFAEGHLGPMPGKWDGYESIADEDVRTEVWGKVGYIHGLSADAGRTIIAIGETLLALKEMLPHGQFMACVKAEFGWSQRWTNQLMQVAERFTNWNSSSNLPSSAKVLALLAAANADDATVQQAAEERWTVQEAKRRLGNERQRQRTVVQEALSVLKLSDEARELAAKAQHISTRQLMDELGIGELPKGKEHKTSQHTFCKNGTGWWKFPIEQPVEVPATPVAATATELLPIAVAAQRLGKKTHTLRVSLTPKAMAQKGAPTGNGWRAEPHEKRGYCIVCKIDL
jgi:hypothetical protein